jgi:hypothetical protein
MRRAIEHKLAQGQEKEVQDMGMKAAAGAATMGALIVGGPTLQSAVVSANMGPIRSATRLGVPAPQRSVESGADSRLDASGCSTFAGAAAGPFTVHFWAPMSKWLISGASFLDLNRPTELVSLTQVAVVCPCLRLTHVRARALSLSLDTHTLLSLNWLHSTGSTRR